MTPAARIAAAAEILDAVQGGMAAEQALTRWARGSRFAGSGDRAAVRDHVFDALRCLRSFAALGGGESGRALMLGMLRAEGRDPLEVFTGEGHAPAVLSEAELAGGSVPEGNAALDCPEWLAGDLARALGDDFVEVMQRLRGRADVFLRVNLCKGDIDDAARSLASDGVITKPGPLVGTCLVITEGARKLRNATAYMDGLVELQDAASQAVCDLIPLPETGTVLDYCAGGGGKSLALAARAPQLNYLAHDANPQRLKDLRARAARAEAQIRTVEKSELAAGGYDVVLVDVPCSGSGAWRRQPEAKWRLDRAGLDQLLLIQAEILDEAAVLCAPNGIIAYVTCSVLEAENGQQLRGFLSRHPEWEQLWARQFTPLNCGDGFFCATLGRSD